MRRVFPEGERRAFFYGCGGGRKEGARPRGGHRGAWEFCCGIGREVVEGPGRFRRVGAGNFTEGRGRCGPGAFRRIGRRRGEDVEGRAAASRGALRAGSCGDLCRGRARQIRSRGCGTAAKEALGKTPESCGRGGGRHAAGAAVFASRFLSVGGKTFIIFLSMLILLIKSVYCRPGRKPLLYRSALRRTIARSGKFRLPRIGWRKNERFI